MKVSIKSALPYIWFIVSFSFIFTHLTNDFFVFWAYGRQVSISGDSGITALLSTWDIKGMLFRAYICHLYDVTNFFTSDFDLLGQAIYKTISILELNIILFLAIVVLPRCYMMNQTRTTFFYVMSIIFMSVHFSCHLQPEMVALPILLLAFSLYLRKTWWSLFVSALFLVLTFLLKSPIPIMGGTIIFATFLMDNSPIKEQIKTLMAYSAIFVVIFVALLLSLNYLYPQEIIDILDASHYQKTWLAGGGDQSIIMSFAHFVFYFVYSFLYYPIFIISVPLALFVIRQMISKRNYLDVLLLIGMWMFPTIYIILSNCYFVYHYDLFLISAVLTIISCSKYFEEHLSKKIIIRIIALSSFIYVFFLSAISPGVVSSNIAYNKIYKESITNGFKYGDNVGLGEIMYLDAGTGPFYIGNRSYLRYLYPLPIERIKEEDDFANSKTYVDTYNKIMSYNGEYLSLGERWFFFYPHPKIENYLNSHYEKDNTLLIRTVSFSWNLFDITPYNIGEFQLYKKKKNFE